MVGIKRTDMRTSCIQFVVGIVDIGRVEPRRCVCDVSMASLWRMKEGKSTEKLSHGVTSKARFRCNYGEIKVTASQGFSRE